MRIELNGWTPSWYWRIQEYQMLDFAKEPTLSTAEKMEVRLIKTCVKDMQAPPSSDES